MKNTHSYPTEADRALAESARGDWARLSNQSIPLAAVVEVVRDGFLVSIRKMKEGWIDDIVSDRDAAVATGRTVEIAFRRAMDKAEEILEHEEVPEDSRRRASIDHRASRHRSR